MERIVETNEIPIGEGAHESMELATLFKVLSKPDALRLFHFAGEGIENSTYAMKELDLTQKVYYARLRELVKIGLVSKKDSVYRQTVLGRMIYDRFLPAMRKTVDAREELEFLGGVEGIEIENGVKKRILEELGIPVFTDSTNIKLLGDYEALAIEAIDLYDSAEESVLLASNYFDVRVMEAAFRATERGVTNRYLVGKESLSSKLKNLRMMLSVTFAKTIINFTTNKVNIRELLRFVDLPYAFCVVDGHLNLIDISNTIDDKFIFALSINDRVVGEKLTDFYETLWKAGDSQSALEAINSLGSS